MCRQATKTVPPGLRELHIPFQITIHFLFRKPRPRPVSEPAEQISDGTASESVACFNFCQAVLEIRAHSSTAQIKSEEVDEGLHEGSQISQFLPLKFVCSRDT